MEHDVLIKIARYLNQNNIGWGLGASYMLHFHGIVEKPRDIDIIVDKHSIDKTVDLLSEFGKLEMEPPKGDYLTEQFYYFSINDTEVDIICNFKLKHESGIYSYLFNENSITKKKIIEDVTIPLTCLEDWYLLYLIMNNKKGRADQIELYFRNNGIENISLIKSAIKQPLPKRVLERVNKLVKEIG